jgi:hypothetical protein
MRTLRIVSRQEKLPPVEGQARTQEVEVTPPTEELEVTPPTPDVEATPPTQESAGRRGEVPIRLESLPTPLRAVVRDHTEGSIRIEAELPWLAVGTVVHAGNPDGTERTGRVRSFDVELTGEGSARLLIYATLAGAPELPAPLRRRQRRSRRSPLLVLALVLGSAASGYVARSYLETVRPAAAITPR